MTPPEADPAAHAALAALADNRPFTFIARGGSMRPFIQDGDQLTIGPLNGPPTVGQVVFVRHGDFGLVHRVISLDPQGAVQTRGDGLIWPDGWWPSHQIIGQVIAIERQGQAVPIHQWRGLAVGVAATGLRRLRWRLGRWRLNSVAARWLSIWLVLGGLLPGCGGRCPADMVHVPGGSFLSGPGKRPVEVADFCIHRTEITVSRWRACVADGGCEGYSGWASCQSLTDASPHQCQPGHDDHPANWLDWYRADQFCRWIGGRLPLPEEWEKAARGEDGRTWPWGEEARCDRAHFARRAPFDACMGEGDLPDHAVPVGQYPEGQSPYGALDMAGNLREWVDAVRGDQALTRGGDWRSSAEGVTTWSGDATLGPDRTSARIGARCVISNQPRRSTPPPPAPPE